MKKIRLRNGFSVVTTLEHRFLVLKDLKFEYVQAKDISKKDAIVCSRKLEITQENNFKEQILKKLAEKPFYVSLKKDAFIEIKENIVKQKNTRTILKNSNINTNVSTFNFGFRKNRFLLKDSIALYNFFEISLENLFDDIDTINHNSGRKTRFFPNLQDFYYLAGLFVGDGTERRFVVGKPHLEKKFILICKNLGFTPKEKIKSNSGKELYSNMTIFGFSLVFLL